MPRPDRLTWDTQLPDWLFMVAVGLAVGLCLAGFVRYRRGERYAGLVLAVGGVALLGFVCASVLDQAEPAAWANLHVKPLVSVLVEGAALGGGVLVGGAFALEGSLAAGGLFGKRTLWLGAGAPVLMCGAIAAGALWWLDWENSHDAHPRHPRGIDASHTYSATPLLDGLNVPTGLAVAPNGDLAIAELTTATVRVYRAEQGGFREAFRARMPVEEKAQAFHVAVHPDYPTQPYVYVAVDHLSATGAVLRIFRVDVTRPDGAPTLVIDGLPTASRELPGDHYGSGMAFCAGYLFVGTADTEPTSLHPLPLHDPRVLRTQAQSVVSGRGKILRWKLEGSDLQPDGLAGSEFPIYALGFRNPYALTCDTETGLPLVADNGAGHGHDQLRLVTPGSNAEWPLSDERDEITPPIFDTGYRVGTAPSGVAVRTAGVGREAIWAGFNSAALYAIPYDSNGKQTATARLLRDVEGGAFGVATDVRGCIYFADAVAVWRLDDGRCSP